MVDLLQVPQRPPVRHAVQGGVGWGERLGRVLDRHRPGDVVAVSPGQTQIALVAWTASLRLWVRLEILGVTPDMLAGPGYRVGLRVAVILRSPTADRNYLTFARERRDRVQVPAAGVILAASDAHGLCYEVGCDGGLSAWFDHEELAPEAICRSE